MSRSERLAYWRMIAESAWRGMTFQKTPSAKWLGDRFWTLEAMYREREKESAGGGIK